MNKPYFKLNVLLAVLLMSCSSLLAQLNITSFSPTNGSYGTNVIITGTGFSPTLSNNVVRFDNIRASITGASATTLTVNVPTGTSSYAEITVTTGGVKRSSANIANGARYFNVTYTGGQMTAANYQVQTINLSGTSDAVATADMNSDGLSDLIVLQDNSTGNDSIKVFRNNGSFNYTLLSAASVGISSGAAIDIADIDNDNDLDIAVSIYTSSGDIKIFTNNGSGMLTLSNTVTAGYCYALEHGDLNADGYVDFVASSGNWYINKLINNQNGTFTSSQINPTGAEGVAVGDFNNDGKLDLVAARFSSSQYECYIGSGTGGFTSQGLITGGMQMAKITKGDFNNDGRLDIAYTGYSSDVRVCLGNGNGTFAAPTLITASNARDVRVGDFDGDGNPDLQTEIYGGGGFYLFKGLGNGGFNPPVTIPGSGSNTGHNNASISDFNNDGKPDLLTSNSSSNTMQVQYYRIPLSASITSSTNVTCNGGADGSAAALATGGFPPYSYSWTGGSTVSNPTNLTAGTKTVTVTDVLGGTATATVTINQPSAITSGTSSITHVNCYGLSTGAATLSVSGGTGPYTYSWAPSGGTAISISSMPAGTYTCTITDNVGCVKTQTLTITQPAAPLSAITASQTNVSCFGGSNATATIAPSGGTSPYTYIWAPSGGTSATVTGRSAGNYTCTITDNKGCTYNQVVVFTQPAAALSASVTKTDVSCNSGANGTATVTASGGTPSYTYSWAPSGGTAATTSGRAAGNYTCTITDLNGCTFNQAVTIAQPAAITSSISASTNVSCNGGANGSATVSVAGGTPSYTYSWTPAGGTAATASGLPAGTYTCTITDANACTRTQTVTITQPAAALSGTITSQTNISCNGGTNGSATLAASGGTSPYTYTWTPSGGTAASISGKAAGTYTCTITDNNGCVASQTVMLTQPTVLSSSISASTNVSCLGGSNGSATVSASGGQTPYTYSWAPSGGTAATASFLNAGTYTCTITDANSCTKTQTVTITQPSGLGLSVTSQTNISCNGASTGAATIAASGGTAPYTYTWTPSGGNAVSISGRTAGSYTCNVTDNNGCTGNISVTLTQPTAISSSIGSSANVSCNGGNNGAATVSVSGGTAPYTYSWSPAGGTAATATGLSAGTYTCSITDNNSCLKTQTVTITEPAVLNSSISASTNVTCSGGTNGSATVSVSGGATPYTYSWSPSGGTAATANGLGAGTYTCTITDNNACVRTQTVNITQPTAVSISFSTSNALCGMANGSATAIPSGGAGGYTYQWNAAAGSQTTATASGLVAGSYVVTVTDASGCTGNNTANVNNTGGPSLSTSSSSASCFGGCNGTASVTPSGGTAPYTYSWAPSGGTGITATGLCAGNYTITVTDANGCAVSGSTVVTQPSAASASFTTGNVSCNGGSNGSATISVSGGTAPYTYSWSPSGGTAVTASGLSAGTYTCSVMDNNACLSTHTVTITQPAALSAANSKTNVSCNGGNNGTATAVPSGGTAPYTYSWAPSGGTAVTATGLSAGIYTCTVTDNNSCVTTTTLSITQPAALTASTSQTNVSCNGLNNGTASVSASGGTAPYSYSWAPAGGTAASATGLSPTAYTCTISDNNGCSVNKTFTITEPALLSGSIGTQTNVSCNAGTDGSASVSVSGGTSPYTYSWAPGGETTAGISSKPAGTYTCSVTDNNSCATTVTVNITQPTALVLVVTGTNVSCNGTSTGSATANATGGTAPYTYNWAPFGGSAATANNLTAGTYTCQVTDANSCISTQTVSITEPPVLSASSSHTNADCNGASTGSANVTASGGLTPYTYSWSPAGGNAASATSLSAGTYTCTITDNNGCTINTPVTITEPAALIAGIGSQNNVSCNAGANGSVSISVSGGTPAYAYNWSPSVGTTASIGSLSAGTYTCNITDANGCSTNTVVVITEPTAISTSVFGTNVLCFGGNSGSAGISVSGGTAAYLYSWAPSGGTGSTASGLTAGTYTCTVTDANGCTANDLITLTEPAVFSTTYTVSHVNCNAGNDGSATIIPAGGTAGYTYSWLPTGGTAATETGLTAGTYTVNLSDANGCFTSNTVTVNEPAALASSTSGTSLNCNGASSGSATISVSGGTASYTYSWSSGGTGTTETGLSAGTYTCIVTDANGCQLTDSYTVTEPAAFFVNMNQLSGAGCAGGTSGSAQIVVSGGTAPYTYLWNTGGTADIETGLSAQSYTCNFTDNNGCTGSGTISIIGNNNTDLFGNLSFPAGTITSGYAYAFRQQTTLNGIDTVAMVAINGGASASYLFSGLPADNYYVKVILDSLNHPTAVPTYYGNTFQWDSSLVISHGCLTTDTADIDIIEVLAGTGSGYISGYVIEGNGYGILRINGNGTQPNIPFAPGGPLKGIDVKLGKNPGGGIQARVMTDSSGFYQFKDVPDGSYNIYVDIPNLPMDSLRQVTIIPGADTSILNNYYADSLHIFIDTAQSVGIYSSAKSYDNNFSIYPNPTSGIMNLQFSIHDESQHIRFAISDALGREVYTSLPQNYTKGEKVIALHAAALNLKAGVYFVSVIMNERRYTQRIVVLE